MDIIFSSEEIEIMIKEYADVNTLEINSKLIAEKLYYYTSGYAFFVSRLCQIIDENVCNENNDLDIKTVLIKFQQFMKE